MSRTDENQRQEDFKSNWRWDKNQAEKIRLIVKVATIMQLSSEQEQ